MRQDIPTGRWQRSEISGRYQTLVALDPATVEAAYRLRYRVFVEELGARLPGDGIEQDRFDPYCDHLVVQDRQDSRIVATTRLLSDRAAERSEGFYSQTEFDIDAIFTLPGRFLEVGRTCIDPACRGSVVLTTLWSGLARYAVERGFDYLMGCASIPPGPSGFAVEAFQRRLTPEQRPPLWLNVRSLRPVPDHLRCQRDDCGLPPLLQTYLRLGAWVCGEPYWDEAFDCMDVFILLPLTRLKARYSRRFIRRPAEIHGHA